MLILGCHTTTTPKTTSTPPATTTTQPSAACTKNNATLDSWRSAPLEGHSFSMGSATPTWLQGLQLASLQNHILEPQNTWQHCNLQVQKCWFPLWLPGQLLSKWGKSKYLLGYSNFDGSKSKLSWRLSKAVGMFSQLFGQKSYLPLWHVMTSIAISTSPALGLMTRLPTLPVASDFPARTEVP